MAKILIVDDNRANRKLAAAILSFEGHDRKIGHRAVSARRDPAPGRCTVGFQRPRIPEEFVLHYQPKVDLETRKLTGVEALIRWQSPQHGLVPPLKFIPFLGETGMIVEVGAWALRQASLDRSRWLDGG